ncbi:sensor histidine kinase [Mangrovivirga cuniculi]|uniref:histidine kinase n=1 Tax=Mangrovivirga cuniculi TaxID=2715131 RepID=A0A4D7JTQ5_9BACT|nr:HAMP domain-containing sensor histidine kinase [Mangrovivirga cuniculi]QCK16940.1 hypothetical protein DCC35_20495 [Mangrovivirga cuniculi]
MSTHSIIDNIILLSGCKLRQIILLLIISISINAQTTTIQVHTLDNSLNPVDNIEVSVEGMDYIPTNSKGIAFVSLDSESLPPEKIKIKNPELEAESWSYSRGILEIILRKKNYEEITFRLVNSDNNPVANNVVILEGPQKITRKSNEKGYVTIPYPKDSQLRDQYTLIVPGYNVTTNKIESKTSQLVVTSLEKPSTKQIVENDEKDIEINNDNPELAFLDTITTIESFYRALMLQDIKAFNKDEKKLINEKFYRLYQQSSFLSSKRPEPKIAPDGNSTIERELELLKRSAENEQESIIQNKNDFQLRLSRVNERLSGQTDNLTENQKRDLAAEVDAIENALLTSQQLFTGYQSDYLKIINELRAKLENLEGIQGQLKKSEELRLKEQEEFQNKLLKITLIFVGLIIFTFILVLLVRIYIRQKNELKSANNEVARINSQLEKLVSDKTQSLVKINNELDQFLYRSAHNLRRPLSSILGLHNIAKLTLEGDSLVLFEKAAQTAFEMDELLQKLQMISHIHLPDSAELVDFEGSVDSILDSFEKEISENNIRIKKDIEPGMTYIISPILVSIILSNLIENSIRFCVYSKKPDPQIIIKIREENKKVKITIRDNGTGISKDVWDKIYDMFFVGFEYGKGNGLGLYITKKAVEVLNGEIAFTSEEQKFTQFDVLIADKAISPRSTKKKLAIEA